MLEAFLKTTASISQMAVDTAVKVDNLDVVRSKGETGEKLASVVAQTAPHKDAVSDYYASQASADQATRTAKLLTRYVDAKSSTMNFHDLLALSKAQSDLTTALEKNSQLMENFKELCKTLQAIRNGNTGEMLDLGSSAISKLVAPFTVALGSGPAAGISLGIMATSAMTGMVAEKVYDRKEEKMREKIDVSISELHTQSNKLIASYLDTLSAKADNKHDQELLIKSRILLMRDHDSHRALDVLSDLEMLKNLREKSDDPMTRKFAKINIGLKENRHAKLEQTLWQQHLEPKPIKKPIGLLQKIKETISPKKAKQREMEERSHAEKLAQKKIKIIDAQIDTLTTVKETQQEILGMEERDTNTVRFNISKNSNASILTALSVTSEKLAQNKFTAKTDVEGKTASIKNPGEHKIPERMDSRETPLFQEEFQSQPAYAGFSR